MSFMQCHNHGKAQKKSNRKTRCQCFIKEVYSISKCKAVREKDTEEGKEREWTPHDEPWRKIVENVTKWMDKAVQMNTEGKKCIYKKS